MARKKRKLMNGGEYTPSSAPYATWPREKVVAAIDEITAAMTGPMSNLDREWANRDRKDLRARLAEIDGAPA